MWEPAGSRPSMNQREMPDGEIADRSYQRGCGRSEQVGIGGTSVTGRPLFSGSIDSVALNTLKA